MVCYSLRCLTRQIDQQTAQRSYLTRFGRRLRRQVMLVLRWSLQENILLDRLRLLEPSSPLLALSPQWLALSWITRSPLCPPVSLVALCHAP